MLVNIHIQHGRGDTISRIVNQDIHRAVFFNRNCNDMLHIRQLGKVALYITHIIALRADLFRQCLAAVSSPTGENHLCTFGCKQFHHGSTHSGCPAADNGYFSF